jgi:hypothetical protein
LVLVSLKMSALGSPQKAGTGLGDHQLEIRYVFCLQRTTCSHDTGQKATQAYVLGLAGYDE